MELTTQTIPIGYKQTEIGIIPADWEVRPLLAAVHIANGQVDPKQEPYKSMILVAPDHIERGTGRLLDKKTAAEQKAISGKYAFEKGNIVYSKIRPYLRKAVLANFDGLCSADMYPLKPAIDVSGRFMLAVILGHRFSKYAESVSVRSGMPKINREELAEYSFALPPLSEQNAVSSVLFDTDILIEKLETLLEKKKNIKQGAMQELLTGKRRLPGFSGEWEMKRLGDFLDYEQPTKYLVKSTDYSDSYNIPVLTAGKTFILGYTAEETGLFQKLPTIIFDDFTTAIKYVDFPFKAKSSAMKMLIPRSKDVNLKFVFAKMQLIDFELGDHKRHWISEYQNIEIEAPESDEQTAIALVLSDMDAEIENLESQLFKYQNLKQGMMQVLLTGKIRLI